MRWALALGLAVSLCTPSQAAPAHRIGRTHPPARHFDGDEATPPGWYRFPGYQPIPPEQNRNLDPSTRGSG